MTWTLVRTPKPPHVCSRPEDHEYPEGTLIRCDECGTYWQWEQWEWGMTWLKAHPTRKELRAWRRDGDR